MMGALLGIASVLYAASQPGIQHADEQLHDAYYVVQPHWTNVFAFLLCLVLAGALVFIGFLQTKKYVTHVLEIERAGNIEPGAPPNAVLPRR